MFKAILTAIVLFVFEYSFSIEFQRLNDSSHFSLKYENVPDSAKYIIAQSLRVFDSIIYTTVPIHIHVIFTSNAYKSNLAASAKATTYEANFSPLVPKDVFYPISLAEKIANRSLNLDNEADIVCSINQNLRWRYSINTDSILPDKINDFYTLFTHEIIHGLGFQSLISFQQGEVNLKSSLSIFDHLIVDSNGHSIVNLFTNSESDSLTKLITGNAIYLNSPHFQHYFTDSLLKLHSPFEYSPGNSIHHFDESIYTDNDNRLMTPLYQNESQRLLGNAAQSVLLDLGWGLPALSHTVPFDNESVSTTQYLNFVFQGRYIPTQVYLDYSLDNFDHVITQHSSIIEDSVSFAIPAYPFNHSIDYRISYIDSLGDYIYIPSRKSLMSFYRGLDTIPPVLNLIYDRTVVTNGGLILVTGTFNDNSGQGFLKADIILDSDNSEELYSDTLYNESFSIQIPDSYYHSQNNDEIVPFLKLHFQYTDFALSPNIVHDTIEIQLYSQNSIVATYKSDFDNSSSDFILDGFKIDTYNNFSSASLQTLNHPYDSPQKDQDTLIFTAELKPRILIDSIYHYLEFDEIALIEPADIGKSFGEFGFWDFVSIEGSKDRQSWHKFEKMGYDASFYDDWYSVYNQQLVTEGDNLNSKSIPTESLYHNHRVNLIGNKYLRKGDTIYIRFILVSDAYSTGWGWSIDNLIIQEGATLHNKIKENSLNIYPQPFSDYFEIEFDFRESKYSVYNSVGQIVMSGDTLPSRIFTSNLDSGIYFLRIEAKTGVYTMPILKW